MPDNFGPRSLSGRQSGSYAREPRPCGSSVGASPLEVGHVPSDLTRPRQDPCSSPALVRLRRPHLAARTASAHRRLVATADGIGRLEQRHGRPRRTTTGPVSLPPASWVTAPDSSQPAVHLAAMSDRHDEDDELVIADDIDDAVVTDPHTEKPASTLESLRARWAGVDRQGVGRIQQAPLDGTVHASKLSSGGVGEADSVGGGSHGASGDSAEPGPTQISAVRE